MNIFTNKSIWKKIAIILVIVMLFQFVVSNTILAADNEDGDVLEGGGKLLKPIFSLLVTVGDGVMDILHSSIMGVDETLIEIDTDSPWWSVLKDIIAVIITAACIIGAIILSGGVAALLAGIAVLEIAGKVLIGTDIIVSFENQAGQAVMSFFDENALPSTLYLPAYSYSPEEIFKGKILLFNVNFFRDPIEIREKTHTDDDGNEMLDYYYYEDNGEEVITSKQDSATMLQKTISSWYNAIRNICLVLMLSVLVYIGIRMLLSSVASDKAKYKTMLKDWFVGLCLLFLMHYIMAFSVTMVDKLTTVVGASLDDNKYIAGIPYTDQIETDLNEINMEEKLRVDANDKTKGYGWPSNLMGYLRLKLQFGTNGWRYLGEAIMFIMLVGFTVMFTFTYLKRLLYMAFLTLIAPVVALTYCIDKLNDGQAQGFNKWFKEYIFNLLIQPMHLLLYYILITSSFEYMADNIIYSIVAIGFMIPAEKLLRSLFGFEKAQTPGVLGPAGAMMASQALTHLLHKGPGAKGKGGASSNGNEANSDKLPARLNDPNVVGAFQNNEEQETNNENTRFQGMDDDYADDYAEAMGTDREQFNTPDQDYWDELNDAYSEQVGGRQNIRFADYVNAQGDIEAPDDIDNIDNPEIEEPIKQKEEKPKRGIRRKISRKAHALSEVGKVAFKRNIQNLPKNTVKTAGRIAAGAALGTLAGGAGVAIGATTGDFSNVVKIGGGAAAGGFAVGSNMANQGVHLNSEYKSVYDTAHNSGEYKQDAVEDYAKNLKKDIVFRNYLEQKVGREKMKEMMKKNGEVDQYIKSGITDKKEMVALHKLKEEGTVKNVEQAIAISDLNQMIGQNTNNMTTKSRNEWKTRLGDMAGNSGVKNKEQFAKNRLKQLDRFNDLKK